MNMIYTMVRADNYQEFAGIVDDHIAKGYVPQGGICVSEMQGTDSNGLNYYSITYFQAMVWQESTIKM